MKKRVLFFDTLKLFSAMWIFVVHFISSFRPSLFRLWSDFPMCLILNGVSGKFAVTVLAVILGYFAYNKGTRNENLQYLVVKRYIHFFVMGLVVNVIYAIYKDYPVLESSFILELLLTSVKIESDIFPTFWCMSSFFWGSVLSYINGRYKISLFPVLMQSVMLALTQNVWISVCLMGNVLYLITEETDGANICRNFFVKPCNQLLTVLFVFIVIKRAESELTYFIDGICSVLILVVITYNLKFQKLLGNTVLSYLGKHSMGIFLLHPIVYKVVGDYIYSICPDTIGTFLLAFCASVLTTIPFSVLIVRFIERVSMLLLNLYFIMEKKAINILQRAKVMYE